MDLRVRLLQDLDEGESVSALAEAYGVSRKTVYKWLQRRAEHGVEGLQDRSRAPHHRPHGVSAEITEAILTARRKWNWGPRKLLVKLKEAQPKQQWPAASTVALIVKRAGLSQGRKRNTRTPRYDQPLAEVQAANRSWCADFKGWFRTADGTRCDPLTITDAHSRYLLRCQIVDHTDTAHVAAVFEAAFREYGLPDVIHTDNGAPFASRAPGGLSRLSMRWVRLGIVPERSRVASPQDNGRHERMHRTLKQDTLKPPAANRRQQQDRFLEFQHTYNHERPHEALANTPPARHYQPSCRPMPRRLPELTYPDDYIVRRIQQHGDLAFKDGRVFLSEILAYELVGLKAVDERYYEVMYGFVRIGWLDSFQHGFYRRCPRQLREQAEVEQ